MVSREWERSLSWGWGGFLNHNIDYTGMIMQLNRVCVLAAFHKQGNPTQHFSLGGSTLSVFIQGCST